jgi:hypothetical protein
LVIKHEAILDAYRQNRVCQIHYKIISFDLKTS